MANTPNVQAPLWAASEASPWLMSGKRARIFDAFVSGVVVSSMSLTAPPGSCADGARFIVHSVATGLWAGHEGQLAIAVGLNASNGWYFATVANEGMLLHNIADGFNYRYHSGNWVQFSDTVSRLQDLLDVDLTGLADGYTLKWDASNGVFYPAPDQTAGGGTVTECIIIAASDESTALAAGTGKLTFRMPYAFTLTAVRASLTTAQASGSIFTVDINESGVSVLSTKLTIDNTEKTSTTAATPAVISDANIADDAEVSVDIDQIGNGTAAGLKVVLIGHQ